MSRGPGVRQREILTRLSEADNRGIYILPESASQSEAASLRRAAYKLEAAGEILVRVHRGRLVAYTPGTEGIPDDRVAIGKDGRLYRSIYGAPRANAVRDLDRDLQHKAFLGRYDAIADSHGHPHGPGILLCVQCAEAAGAANELLDKIRNWGSSGS